MPEFASHEYWQSRFEKNDSAFDWLVPAKAFNALIRESAGEDKLRSAEILHIGCGTAESSLLCELVNDADQIHNIDYSQAAIDAGHAREEERLQVRDTEPKRDSVQEPGGELSSKMRWSCTDLLSLRGTLGLLIATSKRGALYDVVIDKSTSDSIACGTDWAIELPYKLSINGWSRGTGQSGYKQAVEVHPLHVLAVHLAALTRPHSGRWIVVSYSDDRFPFLPPLAQSSSHGFLSEATIQAGFPHPNQLWRLEKKEKIDLTSTETLSERKKRLSSGPVHRPRVSHWLYVLARTDVLITD